MQAGDVLENRYHLIELVGRGRSEVFLARDENLTGKLLAVKVIQKTSKDFDSFQRETLLLAKLNHPGIPIITQQIETETECCVIMNYYNGETLHHYVERIDNGVSAEESLDRQQRENKVIEIFKSICEILIYIHSLYKNNDSGIKAPVIHRDIKPENIMLADSGIKLIDWGIAGEFKRGVPDVGPSWGTPWYAAPEQFASGAKYIDERTDIFSLGATMYYAISSVVPSKDKKNIRPISSVMPDISEGLGIIIDKCMKYNPEDRYQTASELLEDLNHVDSLSRKTRSEKQKSLVYFGLCIGLCIVGLVISLLSDYKINLHNSDNYLSKIQLADAEYDNAFYYQKNGNPQKSEESINKAAEYYKQALEYDNTRVETYERLFACMLPQNGSSYDEASYNSRLTNAIDVMRRQYVDEKHSGVYHSNRLMYLISQQCLSVSDNPSYAGYAVQYLDLIKASRDYRNNHFDDGFSKIEIDSMYLIAASVSKSINTSNMNELVKALENLEEETDRSARSFDERLTNYLNIIKIYNRYSAFISQNGADPYAAVLRLGQKSKEAIESQANYSENLTFGGVIPLYQMVAENLYEQATLDKDSSEKRAHYEQALEWFSYIELLNSDLSARLLLKYGNCYKGIYESFVQGGRSDSEISSSVDDDSYLDSARELYSRVLAMEDTSSDITGTRFSAQVGLTFCYAYDLLYHGQNRAALQTEFSKTSNMMKEYQDKLGISQLSQYQSLKSMVNRLGVQ